MKSHNTIGTKCLTVAGICALACAASLPALADAYSTAVLNKQPVGYWRFNEAVTVTPATATNSGSLGAAGNGYYINGATQIAGPLAAPGSDMGAKFNGFSQKVQVPYVADLNPANELTVEAWVRPMCIDNYNTSWYRAAVRAGGTKAGGGYQLQWDAGNSSVPGVFKLTLWTATSGVETYATIGTTIDATNNGPWFHLVGVWSSSDNTARLYVNGIQIASANRSYTPNVSADLRIGAGDQDPTDPWGQSFNPGAMSQVAVYPVALTAGTVLAHYMNGTNPSPSIAYSDLVIGDGAAGYWRLNETVPAQPVAANYGTVGAALNGTYGYASAPASGPRPGNYAGFDATNSAVSISATGSMWVAGSVWFPPLNLNTNRNMSFVAWIKRNGPQMPYPTILGRRVQGNEKSSVYLGVSNELIYNWDDDINQYTFESGLIVPDNVWTLIGVVITPTSGVVYMDSGAGLFSATNTFANTIATGFRHEIFIGPSGPYQGRAFNGAIDELAVFTNSLSAADMQDLRNAAFGAGGLFAAAQPATRPVILGGSVPFKFVTGAGTAQLPITLQVMKDGALIGSPSPMNANSIVSYPNVTAADLARTFKVVATSSGGSITSSPVAITRASVPGSYSALVESLGPSAYYRLNEASGQYAYDAATGNDAEAVQAIHTTGPQPPTQAGFESGNGANTIGTAVYTAGPSPAFIASPGTAITTNQVTITAWLKPSNNNEYTRGIYFSRSYPAGTYAGFNFADSGQGGPNQLDCTWSGHYNVHSGVFAYGGEWNFVAMVVTATNISFYCDNLSAGWQANTLTMSFSVPNLKGAITGIGLDPYSFTGRLIDGQIDDVAVFNRTLSVDELTMLANAGFNVRLGIQKTTGTNVEVDWTYGTLQWTGDLVNGPWTDVPSASAPSYIYDSATSGQKYFRASY